MHYNTLAFIFQNFAFLIHTFFVESTMTFLLIITQKIKLPAIKVKILKQWCFKAYNRYENQLKSSIYRKCAI